MQKQKNSWAPGDDKAFLRCDSINAMINCYMKQIIMDKKVVCNNNDIQNDGAFLRSNILLLYVINNNRQKTVCNEKWLAKIWSVSQVQGW